MKICKQEKYRIVFSGTKPWTEERNPERKKMVTTFVWWRKQVINLWFSSLTHKKRRGQHMAKARLLIGTHYQDQKAQKEKLPNISAIGSKLKDSSTLWTEITRNGGNIWLTYNFPCCFQIIITYSWITM